MKKVKLTLIASTEDADFGKHRRVKPSPKGSDKREHRETTKRRNTKRRAIEKIGSHYYLTPKAWNWCCSHCGTASSVAYRPADHSRACAGCIERLGIKARESQSWRDGGAKADPTVTVRFVDPGSLRRAA